MAGRSIKSLFKLTALPAFAPFYHSVSSDALPHIWPLYNTLDIKEFRVHLDYMQGHFEFIGSSELLELVNGKAWQKSKPPAFLSFDDGLIECSSIIAPILREKGIPATFFINPRGKIVAYAPGYREWDGKVGRKMLDQLVSEK